MVIARSYILACGRRGAVHFAPSARRCGQKGNTSRGSASDCLSCSGAARARASLRRWSARALDVHAGTYVEVFLIFGVNRRSSWQLCHIPSETGGARASQPTQNRRDGSAGRTGPGVSPGRLFPTARTLSARRASKRARGPWNAYLENLPRGPHSSGSAGGTASFRGTEMVPYLE